MPHEAASRASMATEPGKSPVPSETAAPTKARAVASPLATLVRLLARLAARQVVATGLGLDRVAPDNAASEFKPSRRRALSREIGSIR
jgi:hypothetical protein